MNLRGDKVSLGKGQTLRAEEKHTEEKYIEEKQQDEKILNFILPDLD